MEPIYDTQSKLLNWIRKFPKAWAGIQDYVRNDSKLSEQEYLSLAKWGAVIGIPAHCFYYIYISKHVMLYESIWHRSLSVLVYAGFYALSFNQKYRDKYAAHNRYLWILFGALQFVVLPYYMYTVNNYPEFWLSNFAFCAMAMVLFLKSFDIFSAGLIGLVVSQVFVHQATEPASKHDLVFLTYAETICVGGYAMIYIRTLQNRLHQKVSQVEETYRQLKEYDSKKDEFVASVVHELRTPLSIAMSGLEDMKITQGPAFQKYHALVTSALHNVRSQISDLVEMERDARSPMCLDAEPTDMRSWLDSISSGLLALCRNRGHGFRIDMSHNDITAMIDRMRMETVISNLVNNSVKFTAPGGHVGVVVGVDGNSCVFLEVSDNGCGISEADMPHIFDKYYQSTLHQGKALGIGIGLSLVRKIVTEHAGTVSVWSVVNTGTKIKVTLGQCLSFMPSTQVQYCVCDEAPETSPGVPERPVIVTTQIQAFVVEDSDLLRRLLRDRLVAKGFVVFDFRTPEQALLELETTNPAIVITDMNMPGMDGLEMMLAMRDFIGCIPFVFVTAHTKINELLVNHALTYVVEKPFVYLDLDAAVASALEDAKSKGPE